MCSWYNIGAMKAQAIQLVLFLALLLLIFFGVHAAIMRTDVEGSSMEPNLHDKQLMMLVKAAYWCTEPQRGDVIVFRYPLDPQREFVKRVIGLPGETIECKGGVVYIDGKAIDEPYAHGTTYDFAATKISEGYYFVMGDNRQNSSDSRAWGLLPREDIAGRVWFVFWPLSDWHLLHGYSYSLD